MGNCYYCGKQIKLFDKQKRLSNYNVAHLECYNNMQRKAKIQAENEKKELEKKKTEKELFEQDMKAKGLVKYKGKWRPEEEKFKLQGKRKYKSMPAAKILGTKVRVIS